MGLQLVTEFRWDIIMHRLQSVDKYTINYISMLGSFYRDNIQRAGRIQSEPPRGIYTNAILVHCPQVANANMISQSDNALLEPLQFYRNIISHLQLPQ
jgi:hypothetical protein